MFNSCSVARTPNNLEQLKIYAESSLKQCKNGICGENIFKMNSNKTQCILFATPNFNKRTETFQITIDDTVRHMEDKVKNGTLSYLNRVKNTLDQKSRIPLINALIFSHLNYCSSIWGKCSEKLQCEV